MMPWVKTDGTGAMLSERAYAFARSALYDTANRAMRASCRKAWSREDYSAGIREFDRVTDELAEVRR